MRPLLTVFLFIASILLTSTANAATSIITVAEYEKSKTNEDEWPATQLYLKGVGVGATLTSMALTEQSRASLFCQPEGLELDQKSYLRLIDAFLAKNEIADDVAIESILVMSLVVAFPCD